MEISHFEDLPPFPFPHSLKYDCTTLLSLSFASTSFQALEALEALEALSLAFLEI
jgi:hypothetical protein